jgi:hypothetical protein
MDGREKLATAANDDQRGRELRIGNDGEAAVVIGARGAGPLIGDRNLRAGDRLPFRIEQTRFERFPVRSGEQEKRQRGSAATEAAADTAEEASMSRGMTSVSIARRMCFAMRLM